MIQMVCLQLVPVFIFPEVRQKNICYQPMRRYCQELCLASYGLAQLVVGVSICIWWRQQFYLVIFRRNQSAVVTTEVVLLFRILHENFIFSQQFNPCICKFFISQLVIFYLKFIQIFFHKITSYFKITLSTNLDFISFIEGYFSMKYCFYLLSNIKVG